MAASAARMIDHEASSPRRRSTTTHTPEPDDTVDRLDGTNEPWRSAIEASAERWQRWVQKDPEPAIDLVVPRSASSSRTGIRRRVERGPGRIRKRGSGA